jgi:type IV pilus assembly protein PilF
MQHDKMQQDKMRAKIKYAAVCVFVCMLLQGCVTQSTSGREKKIDTGKALELHIQMAQGYIEKGNRESARHHLKKAFDINKNSASATSVMAQLYLLEGEPVLAETQYKLALKHDPKFTEAYNNYGVFLFNQSRYEESYAMFDKAAADLEYSHRGQALTNLGRVALKLGNMSKAAAAFQHATILDRENPEPYIELADINLQKQEYADAKKYLDTYESLKQPTPRSLVLGIRLEKVFGNKNKEASLVMLLKNRFPYSKEYLEYKNNNFN